MEQVAVTEPNLRASASHLSVVDLLRLLTEGPCGSLFLTLGEGPLRTGELTRRLQGYAPRTVYRHMAKLLQAGLVERRKEEGVPSTVVYRLARSKGRSLFKLLLRHEGVFGNPAMDQEAWTKLLLLGELCELGWIEQLGEGSRSSTELAESAVGVSFHQAHRRVQLLRENNLLAEVGLTRRSSQYQLTEQALRGIAVMLDLARWRQRYVLADPSPGVTVPEVIAALAAWLPQLEDDEQPGAAVKLGVAGLLEPGGAKGSETLTKRIGRDGEGAAGSQDDGNIAAWAAGTTHHWLSALLDGRLDQIRLGGDVRLANSCLKQLHEGLCAADPGS